ncbi:MAG: ABC-2 transporter permease [Solirubrobacterales bacterium]
MLKLIIKDIVIQKRTIPIALAYVVFFIFITSNNLNKGSIYIIGVTLAYMFTLGAIQYEEKYKAQNVIASLPVTRTDMVFSRYFGMIFFTGASTVFICIIVFILNLFNFMPGLENINVQDIKTIIVSAVVLMSIMIPLNYGLGVKKTRFVNVILYLTFFFGLMNIYENIFMEPGNNPIVTFWSSYGLFIALVMLALSIVLSLIIYKNKDIV